MVRFSRYYYNVHRSLGPGGRPATLCAGHRKLSRDIAVEGTVLLKNTGLLPLAPGTRICPFGSGFSNFFFGGGGSGWVVSDRLVSLSDALRSEKALETFSPLLDFYRENAAPDYRTIPRELLHLSKGLFEAPEVPEDLYAQAKAFGGVALLCISRFSTETNHFDRPGQEGDFLLWPSEQALFNRLRQDFKNILVVLNVCGPVSTAPFREEAKVGAIVYPMFGGSYAGEAITEILTGRRSPGGRLTDTLADRIEDYPSTPTFLESPDYVPYEEDIFVGYRYFETFAPGKAVYPFGYGLTYTDFTISCEGASFDGNRVKLAVTVQNIGSRSGREVAQVYLTAPQGKLGKAVKVLAAFGKTRELAPGQAQTLSLSFALKDFASYDDTGVIFENAFILEAGSYTVSLGKNVRDCKACLEFSLEADRICRKCRGYMAPRKLERRLKADGTYEALPQAKEYPHPAPTYETGAEPFRGSLAEALATDNLDGFLAARTDKELAELLYGHCCFHAGSTGGIGMPPLLFFYKTPTIPLVPTADGPAGFRGHVDSGLCTTYFPCANVLAQTWDPDLARRMGKAGALELKESNGGIWLAPALNIHRSPMCGRNFEYYSEDPLISGIFAAAFVRGVQSQGVAATVKHFCCNGKETNRRNSDSRVSQRALREIYLKGFEIAVKSAKPWCVMTAYNLVNGVRSSANWEAIQGILKGEWGFDGLVMTDWHAYSTVTEDILAGSHVKMPESCPGDRLSEKENYTMEAALAGGQLTRPILLAAARQVLLMMDHLE